MAFLPQPHVPSVLSTFAFVPCSAAAGAYGNALDGTGFESYPEQTGWTARTLREWQSLLQTPNQDLQAFFQTWLLSGLLSFMSQEPRDLSVLALPKDEDEAPGLPKISAERLMSVEYLMPLLQRLLQPRGPHDEEIEKLRRCWWKVQRIHSMMDNHNNGAKGLFVDDIDDEGYAYTLEGFMKTMPFTDPRLPGDRKLLSMLLSITESMLWKTEKNEHEQPLPLSSFRDLEKLKQVDVNTASFHFYLRFANQICPSTTYRLYMRLEPPAFWYFMSLQGGPYDQGDHDQCSIRWCKNLQVVDGCYERRHFGHGVEAPCEDVNADQSVLLDILEQGELPLVKLVKSDTTSELVYTSSTSLALVPYVAISHVWSDGLGHDSNNALFDCQLSTISKAIERLVAHDISVDAFWMDTLCVPRAGSNAIDSQRLKMGKRKAISLIRTSFMEAQAVLVMEAWLLATEISGMSDTEILMRILNAPWNSRLWTFQEGATARKLLFQFADGVYDIDAGMARLRQQNDPIISHTVLSSIDRLFSQLRGFYNEDDHLVKLRAVVAAAQLRSSTLAADEPLCLAALLGQDMSRMAAASEDDRMLEFWRMAGAGALDTYTIKARRIQIPGFRWAPHSLLMFAERPPTLPQSPNPSLLMPRSQQQYFWNRGYGFHLYLLNGILRGSMIAFDMGDTPGEPLRDTAIQIEADLTQHPSAAVQQSDYAVWDSELQVSEIFGTAHVVFIPVADERAAGHAFGSIDQSYEGWARDGFLVAFRMDAQSTMIKCTSGEHSAEMPCERCRADSEAVARRSSDATSRTYAETATEAFNHDCGESRPHEHWQETIYLCPARMTLLASLESPRAKALEGFRRDLDTSMHEVNPGNLYVPSHVTMGRWHRENWKVT